MPFRHFGVFCAVVLAIVCVVTSIAVTPGTPASLQIIVVSSPEEAQSILGQLKNGTDFAGLARAKSIDVTASDGGNMGMVDPGSLRLELREALASVEPGELSGIVHIPTGYAILKVVARNAPADSTRGYPTQLLPLSKPEGWEQDLRMSCELRTLSWQTGLERVEKMLAPDHVNQLSPSDFGQAEYVLARLLMFQGDFDQALEHWEIAYRLAVEHFPSAVPRLELSLGIAYLNRSVKRNGSFHTPVETVLFPFPPGSAFRNTADSSWPSGIFLPLSDATLKTMRRDGC
jgi:hypothetical protein